MDAQEEDTEQSAGILFRNTNSVKLKSTFRKEIMRDRNIFFSLRNLISKL